MRSGPRNGAAATRPALGRRARRPPTLLDQRLRRERRWRAPGRRADPRRRGPPPVRRQTRLAQHVIDSRRRADRAASPPSARELRDDVSDDTRETALLVGVGLISGLIAAVLLFGGLIASMRRPLERLVDAAGKLAGGRPAGPGRRSADRRRPRPSARRSTRWPTSSSAPTAASRRAGAASPITLESLSDGVITVDEKGVVTDANPAARRMLPAADGRDVDPQGLRRPPARRLAEPARRPRPGGAPPRRGRIDAGDHRLRARRPRRRARCSRSATSPSARGSSG